MKRLLLRVFRIDEPNLSPRYDAFYDPFGDPQRRKMAEAKKQVISMRDRLP